MPVFSKVLPPGYAASEDDAPPFHLGSRVAWSPAPPGNRSTMARSVLAGPDSDDLTLSDNPSEQHVPRRPVPRPIPRPAASQYRSHYANGPEDRRSRARSHSHISVSSQDHRPHSHSHISVSSDDPDPIESELIRLREEIRRLRTEQSQLQNKLTDLTCVSNLF